MVYAEVCCIHCGCNARRPGVKDQIINIAVNGGGIHDTVRILGISTITVMSTIKQSV